MIPIFQLPIAALEDLIWLVVGLFWLIAQFAASAAKKKRQNPPAHSPQTPRGNQSDPFAEMLKKLTGALDEEEEYFEEEEEPETPAWLDEPKIIKTPAPAFASKNPWKPGDIEKLPDIKPLRRDSSLEGPRPRGPVAGDGDPPALEIPEIDVRPKMSQFRSSIPTIKLPAMNLNFLSTNTGAGKTSDGEKLIDPSDRPALRRAMLSHIIFSKPKALE